MLSEKLVLVPEQSSLLAVGSPVIAPLVEAVYPSSGAFVTLQRGPGRPLQLFEGFV